MRRTTILTTKTHTEKSNKRSPFGTAEKVKSKSPAQKFYPTGVACKREGCDKIGIGDEYCSTQCCKDDNGIEVTHYGEPLFSRSRLGKPSGNNPMGNGRHGAYDRKS